jgi:hypothetical protein
MLCVGCQGSRVLGQGLEVFSLSNLHASYIYQITQLRNISHNPQPLPGLPVKPFDMDNAQKIPTNGKQLFKQRLVVLCFCWRFESYRFRFSGLLLTPLHLQCNGYNLVMAHNFACCENSRSRCRSSGNVRDPRCHESH